MNIKDTESTFYKKKTVNNMTINTINSLTFIHIPLCIQDGVIESIIIPSQGFSAISLWRGVLGIFFYFFSFSI